MPSYTAAQARSLLNSVRSLPFKRLLMLLSDCRRPPSAVSLKTLLYLFFGSQRLYYTGTDLHILKGDVPTCPKGRILGHEGIGVVESVGNAVTSFKPGDNVIISCITSCATCEFCRRGMPSHCTDGGWTLGHTIDGTQAEYVRIPHADSSLHSANVKGASKEALVMISDALPTGFECGTLNGDIKPGSTVAVIGACACVSRALISDFPVIDYINYRWWSSRSICTPDCSILHPFHPHYDRPRREPLGYCQVSRSNSYHQIGS